MTAAERFMEYLDTATTPIQSVTVNIQLLEANGFEELMMGDSWRVEAGGSYYVRPYPTALFAFRVGAEDYTQQGFRIITSHTDYPCFKVKPNPEMVTKGYVQLNTEVYAPPMFYTWMDRPLSLGGQVVLRSDEVLKPKVIEVDFHYPLLTIPSLAPHYNRTVNTDGATFNPQKEMMPIMDVVEETFEKEGYMLGIIAEEIGCDAADILDYDLYVYVKEEAMPIGPKGDLVTAPRVDNQASVFSSVLALIDSAPGNAISIAACFDNEEIGSVSAQGADSSTFHQIVNRIALALHKKDDMLYRMLDRSFMISADGAHAVHPNYMEKNDVTNFPVLGGGVVIKVSAKQSYMTDGFSGAVFAQLCEAVDVNYQKLVNRSDMPGGRTLGPMAAQYLPMNGVDVGIPMLGMHSAKELFSASDFNDMVKVFTHFYSQ